MLWRMSADAPALRVPGEHLVGRRREREVLDRLLHAARNGSGGVLVLYGEPGVGKTALLEYAVEASPAFRVARTIGVEGEMELAFAALQNLCSPLLKLMQRLPQPQRNALVRRLRTQRRPVAESLPRGAGGPWPVVGEQPRSSRSSGVIDDAQWLDRCIGAPPSPSWLAACWRTGSRWCSPGANARRRDPRTSRSSTSRRWGMATRGRCWSPCLPARLDDGVLERIVVETRGNPLALHRATARVDTGAARGWLRPTRRGAVVGQHRRKLHASAGETSA